MDSVEVVVVGAGIVGLAVAREFATHGFETLVLERHDRPGQETTSRNSGVIHSGIYYPTGSLKARLCVRGRALLYEYCRARDISHRRCGKLIVAQEQQLERLHVLRQIAIANGVDDLKWLDANRVRGIEPHVRCAAALLSPSTGIVDVHELLMGYLGDFEASGGVMVLRSEVSGAEVTPSGFVLDVQTAGSSTKLHCQFLVNSTGIAGPDFLARLRGYPQDRRPKTYYAKGNYFVCQGARPFQHLVYPMPNEAGLGVHATLDLDGTTRFGPDVEWVECPEYSVDPARADRFYEAIREYWPGLPDGALQPGYAGIRPKLVGPGEKAADFVIETSAAHGVRGLVNLLGIESPGLTSALAIAEYVVQREHSSSDNRTQPLPAPAHT